MRRWYGWTGTHVSSVILSVARSGLPPRAFISTRLTLRRASLWLRFRKVLPRTSMRRWQPHAVRCPSGKRFHRTRGLAICTPWRDRCKSIRGGLRSSKPWTTASPFARVAIWIFRSLLATFITMRVGRSSCRRNFPVTWLAA